MDQVNDPFNCPTCGAHDFGLYAVALGGCPHCIRAALAELVRLKDLHDASGDGVYWETRPINESTLAQLHAWRSDYEVNKPKAWDAARKALGSADSARGEQ